MALLFEQESYAILGACFEVYKQLGTGFLEPIYHQSLAIEFEVQGIPFIEKPKLEIEYKGRKLALHYEPDFVCYGGIIVELKAVTDLNDVFRAQVHNYLKATGFRLGLLVNFTHHPKLEYERIVR
ncbi:GTP-binding protein [Planctomyces sp. SCGC AG-212-M04]|nr:GTP-binding protein [Planctomyces sp. SCGC AG-212-M04]